MQAHTLICDQQIKNVKQLLLVIIALLTGGLFIGGPDYYDHRIIKELWESGHFILFLFLSFFLFTYSKLNRIEAVKRSAIILGALLVFGFLTEVVQSLVGRNYEAKDLLNDLLGALTGLLIPHLRFKTNLSRFVLLVSLIISLVTFSFRPLLFTVIDAVKLQQDFPILSDFETPSQLKRWEHRLAKLSISESKVRDGEFSMRAELFPGKYPGITLKHLHENWQGYQSIKFSVYLDAEYPVNLMIKVYDQKHPKSGYNHSDRFNGRLSLNPGWNDCLLPLHSIENAPAERLMNMKKIASLSLFTTDLKQKLTLYLDSLQLTKD